MHDVIEEATPEDIAYWLALRSIEGKERAAAERKAKAKAMAKRR